MKRLWLSKEKCTGCGACSNICPKQAVSMTFDSCGFIYPEINSNCIDCNLCEKVCNRRGHIETERTSTPSTYAAWSNNEETRFSSTSGGIFSELVFGTLNSGGYVAGAQYNVENMVEHALIHSLSDLKKIRQSKYTQSNTREIYIEVKNKLNINQEVVFCGAPCQVAALYAFLGHDYDKLITIDFICRGMNSPKAYKTWLEEIEEKEHHKIINVWFKYKEGGWKSSPRRTRIDFDDGHYILLEGEHNLFMHGYLTSNLYIRPSCAQCDFKGVPRQGDITLADFWGIDKTLDDDKGTSMVLLNSSKGERLFEEIKGQIFYNKRDFQEIFPGNVCFHDSVRIHQKSEAFLHELDRIPFSKAVKKYTKKTITEKTTSIIKRIQRKL